MLTGDFETDEKIKNFEFCFNDFENATLTEPKEFAGRNPKEAHEDIIDFLVKNK
jgi:hypothetical protein